MNAIPPPWVIGLGLVALVVMLIVLLVIDFVERRR